MQNLQFGGVIGRFAASEFCDRPWSQVENGPPQHALDAGDEIRACDAYCANEGCPRTVFMTERDKPMTRNRIGPHQNPVLDTNRFVAG
jgi:hypothetical protein